MPQPIICLNEEVCHFTEHFRAVFSKLQYQYFVTALLGLMECKGKCMLSGVPSKVGELLISVGGKQPQVYMLSGVPSKVGEPPSLSGLSWFFSEASWVQEALVVIWLEHFRAEMQPLVEAEREQQQQQ